MGRLDRAMTLEDLGLAGVKQTVLGRGPDHGEPHGNCQQAALATVLGLPLHEVPHFMADGPLETWWERQNTWLQERFGLYAIGWAADYRTAPPVLHLMNGRSCRPSDHVVVAFEGVMMFDPHPSATGLIEVTGFEFFLPRVPVGRHGSR